MDKNLRLQVILGLTDKLLKPMQGNQKAARALNEQLRAQQAQLKALKAAQTDVATYRGLKTSLAADKRALAAAQEKAQALGRAHAAAEAPTRKMTTALARARAEVNQLKTAEGEHVRKLNEVRARMNAAGVSTRTLGRDEKALRDNLARTNTQIDAQKAKLKQLGDQQRRSAAARDSFSRTQAFAGSAASAGAGSIGAGVAVAAPLVIASREAMKFEDAMADVRKVVDFPTPASFAAFSGDLLNLSTRLPVAADGLAQIAALGARAGVPLKDLSAFTETAAKMGVAFDLSAEEAGSMMATWRAAFGMGQDEVTRLANQVNALTNDFGGSPAAISEMITRIGPLGDVAGVSAASIAAMAQVMNKVGVESEIGATGIKNMMLALTKGEVATKNQKKAFAALGLDAAQVSRQMQTDSVGAIEKVLEAVAKLPEARRAGVLTQLFGAESVAAIAPMLTRLDLLQANFRAVGDATFYASSMDEEYARRAATTSNALQLAKNNANALGVEIGTMLLPTIREVSTRVGNAAQHVRNFAAAHPKAAKAIAMVVGIVAAALLVFGGLALIVSAVLMPFAALRLALALTAPMFMGVISGLWGAVTATWAFTAALLANPITWIVIAIVAAVALLAGAAYLIYRNWGPISAWFGGVWTRVKEMAVAAFNFLKTAIMNFSPVGLFVRAFMAVWPFLTSIGDRFQTFGGQLILGIINGVLGGVPRLLATIMRVGGRLITAFKNKLGIHSPSRVFADFGDHTMAGLAVGIERARNQPLDALGGVGAAMAGAMVIGSGGSALAAPAASGAAAPIAGGDTYITVHALPGQDARQIALEVKRLIDEDAASRRRRSFEDDPE